MFNEGSLDEAEVRRAHWYCALHYDQEEKYRKMDMANLRLVLAADDGEVAANLHRQLLAVDLDGNLAREVPAE